ncbi:MAG: hypothetical protein JO007_22105 [Alphaproteobacteria bacterium]|nr:hypothetical protein [Alphaproteobacteria bacterium]
MAPAIEIDKLLLKFCFLLFERSNFLFDFRAQLGEIVGVRIRRSRNRQRDDTQAADEQ